MVRPVDVHCQTRMEDWRWPPLKNSCNTSKDLCALRVGTSDMCSLSLHQHHFFSDLTTKLAQMLQFLLAPLSGRCRVGLPLGTGIVPSHFQQLIFENGVPPTRVGRETKGPLSSWLPDSWVPGPNMPRTMTNRFQILIFPKSIFPESILPNCIFPTGIFQSVFFLSVS